MRDEPVVRPMTVEDWNIFHKFDRKIFPDDLMTEGWFKKRIERDGFFTLD